MNYPITISLAGHPIRVLLNFPENASFFREFLTEEDAEDEVCVSMQELEQALPSYPAGSDLQYVECGELTQRASHSLMKYKSCIFHGMAFLKNDKAWLFTAPPGTGKTTQYFLWKSLYPDDITLINGDKCVLSCGEQEITVSSSPWKGKEGIHNLLSAPLGGIIYLRQAKDNAVSRFPAKQAVPFLFHQFLLDQKQKDAVLSACDILETMLRHVPVWILANRGDPASVQLTRRTVMDAEAHLKS